MECRRDPRHFFYFRTRLGYGPVTSPTLKTALCHTRTFGGVCVKYKRANHRVSAPLQLLDHTSASRVVHCSVLVWCVTGQTSGRRGPSPQALSLFRGVRLIAWRLRRPFFFKENADGTRLGYGPATGPTEKRPCATHVRLVESMSNNSSLISVLVRLSSCWVTLWPTWSGVLHHSSLDQVRCASCTVQVGCASSLYIPLASWGGGFLQALTLFGSIGLIAWCLRHDF